MKLKKMSENNSQDTNVSKPKIKEGFVQVTKDKIGAPYYEDVFGNKFLFQKDFGLLLNKKNARFDELVLEFKRRGYKVIE